MIRALLPVVLLTVPVAGFGEDFGMGRTTFRARAERTLVVVQALVKSSRVEDVVRADHPAQVAGRISKVIDLQIHVAGRDVHVPLSAFMDLLNPVRGHIESTRTGYRFVVEGGDASESYRAVIEFDAESVRRRAIYASESPDAPTQETVYRTSRSNSSYAAGVIAHASGPGSLRSRSDTALSGSRARPRDRHLDASNGLAA